MVAVQYEFHAWPENDVGLPRGPLYEEQRLLWFDQLTPEKRKEISNLGLQKGHDHPITFDLLQGGKGAGKTIAAVARCIEIALGYEGCEILVGAKDNPQLERTAKNEWRKRFSIPGMPEWKHPLVIRKPTDKDKRLLVRTWTTKCKKPGHEKGCWDGKPATVWFIHFDDNTSLRGVNADIIHIEEACLIEDRQSFTELITRLRGSAVPFKQVILTTNPESRRGWLSEMFCLEQFTPTYKGARKPIGQPCSCQFCQTCKNFGMGEWTWGEDGRCSNPNCAFKQYTPVGKDPEDYRGKRDNKCPGNQYYHRVIFVATHQNPALKGEFVQSMLGSMDKATAEAAIMGKQIYLTEGKVYKGWDPFVNIIPKENEFEFNPDQDAFLALDFNVNPQCSIIIQERTDGEGNVFDVGIDEFVLWKADPDDVGKAVGKYLTDRRFRGRLLVYGDPNGLNGDTKSNLGLYKDLFDGLDIYKIKYEMKVPDNSPISVMNSVKNANALFKNAKDESRFFVNARCEWYICSIEETEWDKNGDGRINKQCDHNAYNRFKESGETPPEKPVALTHPSDSVRYYLTLRHPILMERKGARMMQLPGDSVIRQDQSGKVMEYDRRKGREPERQRKEPKPKKETLNSLLRQTDFDPFGGASPYDFRPFR